MTELPLWQQGAGIAFGLLAALFQALSYVASRRFLTECRPASTLLFAASHLQMGAASLLALLFLWPSQLPAFQQIIWPLLGTSVSYLLGQWMLFRVLRQADSSQISPLLGFKVPMLALATAVVFDRAPSPIGWGAVILCTASGLIISPPHGLPQLRVLLLTALTCLGYCGSDLCIPILVRRLAPVSQNPVLLGVTLTYLFCGLVGLILCAHSGILRDARVQRFALPHATSWFLAMCCLFSCFAAVGVVAGNMLQASRGLLSIAIGMLITRLGLLHLDNLNSRRTLLQRGFGAIGMTAAILLYLYTQKTG